MTPETRSLSDIEAGAVWQRILEGFRRCQLTEESSFTHGDVGVATLLMAADFVQEWRRVRHARPMRSYAGLGNTALFRQLGEELTGPYTHMLLEGSAGAVLEYDERPAEVHRDSAEALREERDRLFVEKETLRSRLAEEQRRAADALAERDRMRKDLDRYLDSHSELAKSVRALQAVLLHERNGTLRMREAYHGRVEQVHDDRAFVTFETEEDPIHHVYEREQFMGGELPEKGLEVTVYVFAATGSSTRMTDTDVRGREGSEDSVVESRRNVQSGPCTI